MLRDYLTGKRQQDRRLRALAALAVRVVEHDDVLVSVRAANPTSCALCNQPRGAKATAVQVAGHTEVILVCPDCDTDHLDYKILQIASYLETCFLWQVGDTIQMMDNDLNTEILNA